MPKGYPNSRRADCHPDRPHFAKGLCLRCYRRLTKQRNRQRNRPKALCHPERSRFRQNLCFSCYGLVVHQQAVCHPDRPMWALGLCKACYKEKRKPKLPWKIRPKVKDYNRRANLKQYGITIEQFDAMVISQGGRCALCQKTVEHTLNVDHCHQTSQVRGLLCRGCNVALGHYERLVKLPRLLPYLAGNYSSTDVSSTIAA